MQSHILVILLVVLLGSQKAESGITEGRKSIEHTLWVVKTRFGDRFYDNIHESDKKLAQIRVNPYFHYMGNIGKYRPSKFMMTMRRITFFFKFFRAIFKLSRCKQVGY